VNRATEQMIGQMIEQTRGGGDCERAYQSGILQPDRFVALPPSVSSEVGFAFLHDTVSVSLPRIFALGVVP